MKLFDIWHNMAEKKKFDLQHADENLQELLSRYSEPRRKYRTIEHLNRIVVSISKYEKKLNAKEPVYLAAFYHEIVFDPRSDDNTLESSKLARQQMAGMRVRQALLDEACRLIELTDHKTEVEEDDEKILLDCDIIVLADDTEGYDEFRENLRAEKPFLSDDEFKPKRREEVEALLARESIFRYEPIREELESKARKNLERELKLLK